MMRLREKYKKEVIPEMEKRFGYKNPMAVPKVEKIIVNTGFGRIATSKAAGDKKKTIDDILKSLSLITGQKPALRKAKKSISSFKLRKGMPVGAQVTLRNQRMYDFMEKLILLVLPRIRDFRGISVSKIDKEGNLTIGLKECTPFLELDFEKEKSIFGLEITIVTSAKTREEAVELFKALGFPIKLE